MKWKQFTIHTTTEAEELITSLLSDLDITNVEVKDHQPVMDDESMDLYEDVMPKLEADDGLAEIVFYVDEDADTEELLQNIRDGIEEMRDWCDPGEALIEEDETEDKDWVNNWKEHFHAFMVDDILIKPTWVEMPEGQDYRLMIEIDPGTAFGTGSHETTKLCIHGLEKYLKEGDQVLDVGTGSGILGIIARKMGAAYAFGTDIDELAVSTAQENIELNGIEKETFPVIVGNIIGDEEVQAAAGFEKYDVVVANILADVIIPLQKEVTRHMKKGAVLVTSGIINLKEEAVRAALLANEELEIVDTTYEGEWVSFAAVKK